MDANGIVAVITGGSSGIGRQLAEDLASRGAEVEILARGADAVADTVTAIVARGGRAVGRVCDVSDADAVTETFTAIEAQHGRIDLLVCCAGISPVAGVAQSTPAELERVVRVDLLGMMWCAQAAIPLLPDGSGTIVTFSSNIAQLPIPLAASYCASKAGVVAFSESLGLELADRGIRVLTVYPAFVPDTRMAQEDIAVRGEPAKWMHRDRRQVSAAVLAALDERRRIRLVLPPAMRVAHLARALAPAATLRMIGRSMKQAAGKKS
jgi:NAD(P)-dependent dehydrogenase (short-subunit alcohol dehydrogenase family)